MVFLVQHKHNLWKRLFIVWVLLWLFLHMVPVLVVLEHFVTQNIHSGFLEHILIVMGNKNLEQDAISKLLQFHCYVPTEGNWTAVWTIIVHLSRITSASHLEYTRDSYFKDRCWQPETMLWRVERGHMYALTTI